MASWNILADGLAQSGKFASMPDPDASLAWAVRAPQVLAEIGSLSADVVCLQECNHWHDTLAPALCLGGPFAGVHTVAGEAAERLGGDADGEALLVRRDRLELLSARVVRFAAGQTHRGIVAVARDRAASRRGGDVLWVLCTSHFKAKEGEAEARTRQAQISALLSHADAAAATVRVSGARLGGVVVVGDMNEAPGDSAGVEAGAAVPRALSEPEGGGAGAARAAADVVAGGLSAAAAGAAPPMGARGVYATAHAWPGLRLRSAHAAVGADGATAAVEEGVTTFKSRTAEVGAEGGAGAPVAKARVIDFVWAGAGARCTHVLRLPDPAVAGELGLPTAAFPSDHVPVLAVLTPAAPVAAE